MGKRIHIEDHGQDFLIWEIDNSGKITDCSPFQASVWEGFTVINHQQLIPGGEIVIATKSNEVMKLNYPVEKVEDLANPLKGVTEIRINGKFMLQLNSKREWINKLPEALPKISMSDQYLFVDKNGDLLTIGLDFNAAEQKSSYPVRIYLAQRTSKSSIVNHKSDITHG